MGFVGWVELRYTHQITENGGFRYGSTHPTKRWVCYRLYPPYITLRMCVGVRWKQTPGETSDIKTLRKYEFIIEPSYIIG